MLVYKRSHMIKKGISLVELMVLVLILAILSSVVFPHIRGMFRRSHEAKVKSNMFALKIATENFSSMAHGLYPIDPTCSVQQVLSDIGIPSANQIRLADNCPATCFDVNTGSGFALLPGDRTYINPFLSNGYCLDNCSSAPVHTSILPYSSGQGTVYWNANYYTQGTYSTRGYTIYGDGYRAILMLVIWSQ